jgi:hypothetical protein
MMSSNKYLSRTLGSIAILLGLTVALTNSSQAQDGNSDPEITMILEQWEVKVADPDVDTNSPQLSTIMTPDNSHPEDFFAFELNHSTIPEFSPGGMQVQYWSGDQLSKYQYSATNELIDESPDTIIWTQRLSLNNGQLRFQIINGDSESFGDFGGSALFTLTTPSNLQSLNAYSYEESAKYSNVTYGTNRVEKMQLKRVRFYSGSTLVKQMNTPIVVDNSSE